MTEVHIDPSTNLPELPSGYYWHVGWHDEGDFGDYYGVWGVEIRQRYGRRENRSRPTAWRMHSQPDANSVCGAAVTLATRFWGKLANDMNRNRLSGDYPPKRLEQKK